MTGSLPLRMIGNVDHQQSVLTRRIPVPVTLVLSINLVGKDETTAAGDL